MDELATSALITKLALDMGVRLIDVRAEPDYCERANMDPETFVDRSFCIGDEIILGVYEDQELRLVSFLHELGHIKAEVGGGYENERRAWEWAGGFAEELGLRFSDKTLNWCQVQLDTHESPPAGRREKVKLGI